MVPARSVERLTQNDIVELLGLTRSFLELGWMYTLQVMFLMTATPPLEPDNASSYIATISIYGQKYWKTRNTARLLLASRRSVVRPTASNAAQCTANTGAT